MQTPDWFSQYQALVQHAGLVELGQRTQIELTGADRATFLHNLCTNEVRRLGVGSGCEAFLTSVQGKTLAHVFIFVGPDSIVLDTVPGQGAAILKHLDHYLVCEQVTLADRSSERSAFLLSGPDSRRLLETMTDALPGAARLAHGAAKLAGHDVWLRQVDWAGPVGFEISLPAAEAAVLAAALEHAGATRCGYAAFDAARIEQGLPFFGADISDQNLPQEIARDAQAISFVKGCYLGQETVARIDALGHVNKTLVGLRFEGSEIPRPGGELRAGEQTVGAVTSAAYSPHLAAPLALGFVRRGSNAPGTRLQCTSGEAEVVALPVR